MNRLAPLALVLGACLVDNSHYRSPTDAGLLSDQAPPGPPDLSPCPIYPAGGGAGMDRPQVLVPGGSYQIGGASFTTADFYLDVFLVTVAAYRDCVASGACSAPAQVGSCNYSAAPASQEQHPVNCVTWAQAEAFCQWTGRRLPSEGEWQYTAAGPRRSAYPWGDATPQLGSDGGTLCSAADGTTATCPVGGYPRTLLGSQTCQGVADLAGDLWEWTQSQYQDPYVFPELPCTASASACALRGGAGSSSEAAFFGTTYRYGFDPSFGLISFGLRCARSSGAAH